MKTSAQKTRATTQKFIEVTDIIDDVVLLSGGQACLIMETTATNFSLQSIEEQQSRILSYAALLNSLSFPIQILIVSRKLDISSYIGLLEHEAAKNQNPALSSQIRQYKDFISQIVRVNTVLDKNFYIIVSFSLLEKGATGVNEIKNKDAFLNDAKLSLHSKAQSVTQELLRVGLKSKTLQKDELIKLFFEMYNSGEAAKHMEGSTTEFVKGVKP